MSSTPSATSPDTSSRLRVAGPVLWVGVAAAVGVLLLVVYFVSASQSSAKVQKFVVPPGTGARIDAGEKVELIPPEVRIRVGDELVVVNQDDRDHVVGPFSVRAGETLRHVFDRAGLYEGLCTVHSGNRVQIIVS